MDSLTCDWCGENCSFDTPICTAFTLLWTLRRFDRSVVAIIAAMAIPCRWVWLGFKNLLKIFGLLQVAPMFSVSCQMNNLLWFKKV